VVPVVAFLVGIAVGALLLWAVMSGPTADSGTPAGAAPTGTASAPGAPGAGESHPTPTQVAVTVPASCTELARDVGSAVALLDEAAGAARNVDASRLADLVRRMGEVRTTLEAEASRCRAAAASASVSVVPTASN
jgi:hypothetical protein